MNVVACLQRRPVTLAVMRIRALMSGRRRRVLGWIAALIALAVSVVVATSLGAVDIPPLETARIVLAHLHLGVGGVERGGPHDLIIWDVRLPRIVTAGVVGASLAAAGTAYQGVFRNPLADPYLLGVAAGAALGATIAILSPLPLDFYGFGYVALFAFAGAMAAVILTYELARIGRTVPAVTHVLAGVAVAAAASAATSMLMLLSGDRIFIVFAWLFGDFTTANWGKLRSVAPYIGISVAVLLLLRRQLNVLQVGEEEARTLGVRVEWLKIAIIVTASLAAAACVAVSGIIGFVGLVVPHACRLVCGPDYRLLLPLSMVAGAALLIWADLAARTVIAPQEIPVGILTASIGAPFFLILLRRQRRLISL